MAYQSIPGTGSGLQFLNYPFGDTTYTKVFVGGLAWETQSETLRRHFEQYGQILEAVVITDKHTGRSKGYGFVTFCDSESAKKACVDPNPVIDGRRANCNLASLGRPQPALPYGYVMSKWGLFYAFVVNMLAQAPTTKDYFICILALENTPYPYRDACDQQCPILEYTRCLGAHTLEAPVSTNQYTSFGPEYAYPQGVYNPHMGQHYLQIYGVPGTVNTNIVPYGQMGHPLSGNHGYPTIQGYVTPGRHVLQYGGPLVSGVTTDTIATTQAPYLAGIAAPAPGQARIIMPGRPPQFIQSSGSDQMAGRPSRVHQGYSGVACTSIKTKHFILIDSTLDLVIISRLIV
ncbi:hypothetical protein HYC85_005357 [Camellia sinensis]|uniref:RRM domain-containing protein n=1 Tax=Camellia sinensis TaxID=4442 RepID=A0A7J7HZA3_CAMSI|nr:hypothetical protein HYC85_005357 [Camellia sinensis]